MTRMNHSQLIQFLINENYVALAMDFSDVPAEDIVDGEIDANLVKSMIEELDPSGLLLRKIQANVVSYLYTSK
jgi:hypothetical protein